MSEDNIRQFPAKALEKAKEINVYNQARSRRPRRSSDPAKIGDVLGTSALEPLAPEDYAELKARRAEKEQARIAREAAREAEKAAVRPRIDFVPAPVSAPSWTCPYCKMATNGIDTHGKVRTRTGDIENCPECYPVVQAARQRRAADRYIADLVKSGKLLNCQNLPANARNLSIGSYPGAGDQDAKADVEAFVRADVDNMILIGGVGRGKTGLALAAAQEMAASGEQVLFLPMKRYISLLQENFGGAPNNHIKDVTQMVRVLVLDDLGTERVTDTGFSVEETCELIEHRLNAGLRTLITTNFTLPGLETYYQMKSYEDTGFQPGERIISRLHGYYQPVTFHGPDLRRL